MSKKIRKLIYEYRRKRILRAEISNAMLQKIKILRLLPPPRLEKKGGGRGHTCFSSLQFPGCFSPSAREKQKQRRSPNRNSFPCRVHYSPIAAYSIGFGAAAAASHVQRARWSAYNSAENAIISRAEKPVTETFNFGRSNRTIENCPLIPSPRSCFRIENGILMTQFTRVQQGFRT